MTAAIIKYTPLVMEIAKQMIHKLPVSVEIDDLIQVGMIGLMQAVERYTQVPGVRFEAYAQSRIRGAMLDELRKLDWLPKVPRRNVQRIETVVNVLEQRLFRTPTAIEVANELGVELEDYRCMSLDLITDQFVYYDEFAEIEEDFLERHGDYVEADLLDEILEEESVRVIIDGIETLTPREKSLMEMYYAKGFSLKKAGSELGVGEPRACQIHSSAIAKLKDKLRIY